MRLAELEQAIEVLEAQHARDIARIAADVELNRHERSARLARVTHAMQQRINKLIQQVR